MRLKGEAGGGGKDKMLTSKQILFILELIEEKHGPGYADDRDVIAIQSKLSIMLQIAREKESK